jgi:UDP-N-acetylmuramate--alanine ligase
MVGIGGSGMCGIAEVLLNLGYAVSGSDLARSPVTDRLTSLGAMIAAGHRAEAVHGAAVVVTSTAVRTDNPEVKEARRLKIPVIRRAEMLAELMRMKYGIAVAGAHGKTTTTSLVSAVLSAGGLDPTVVVGGRLKAVGANARAGTGKFLVAEADESDGSFLQLRPSIAVITNIDREHLDHWKGGIEEIQTAFVEFANSVPFYGLNVICLEDPMVQQILPRLERRIATYGYAGVADFQAREIEADDDLSTVFDAYHGDELLGRMRVRMPGRHNVLNALAAIAVGRELDVPAEAIRHALDTFDGVGRRFEVKGEEAGILVVDDYGHHPTEIAAVLKAAKEHGGRRVVALFQPHRYTRTRDLLPEFGRCFYDADLLFVTDVYPAGEDPIEGATGAAVAAEATRYGHPNCTHVAEVAELPDVVRQQLRSGDLVLTLGAGNIYQAGEALLLELVRHGTREKVS